MKQLVTAVMLASGAMAQTIQVHGHRGARAMRPENTLPAFEYAIAQGVDAIELDMAVTRAKVILVSHDPPIPAPGGSGSKPQTPVRVLPPAEDRHRAFCPVR